MGSKPPFGTVSICYGHRNDPPSKCRCIRLKATPESTSGVLASPDRFTTASGDGAPTRALYSCTVNGSEACGDFFLCLAMALSVAPESIPKQMLSSTYVMCIIISGWRTWMIWLLATLYVHDILGDVLSPNIQAFGTMRFVVPSVSTKLYSCCRMWVHVVAAVCHKLPVFECSLEGEKERFNVLVAYVWCSKIFVQNLATTPPH